jgi:hypothetical protein
MFSFPVLVSVATGRRQRKKSAASHARCEVIIVGQRQPIERNQKRSILRVCLSQKDRGELRIFNAAGEVVVTRRDEAVRPMDGAVGGLSGPSNLQTGSAIHPIHL